MICLFWIFLFVLFRSRQRLASPPCPTSVSHPNVLTVLSLSMWASWEVALDMLNRGGFLQLFCCCLPTRHLLQPHSDQRAPQLQVSIAGAFRKGRAETAVFSNSCLPDAGSISVLTPALWLLACRTPCCVPISHKLGQAKHLKHNTYLW